MINEIYKMANVLKGVRAMQMWEYISIRQATGLSGQGGGVYYILPDGEEKKHLGADLEGKNIHKLLNFFESQGYELVEAATSATSAGIFQRIWALKRPNPGE